MLTRKQHELICFIDDRLRATGVSPSFEEMKEALDLKSKSGVHRLISALEEREFIRRLPNRARALEVLRLPESASGAAGRRFTPSVVEGGLAGKTKAAPQPAAEERNRDIASIPVMGRIAAGTPISAIQDQSHTIAVPPEMLGGGEHFALEVRGDSMIEAGIFDGDTVVILESMKMEMPVESEDDGTVKEIRCEEGQSVQEGEVLVVLE